MGAVLALGLIFVPDAVGQIDRLPDSLNAAIGVAILAGDRGLRRLRLDAAPYRHASRAGPCRCPAAASRSSRSCSACSTSAPARRRSTCSCPAGAPTPFLTFAVIYVLAPILGVASHAPGGIGVFEATMLVALPSIPRDQLLGSILLYRVIYYFVPFALALATLGAYEFARRRHLVGRLVDQASDVLKPLAPILIGGAVFMTGASMIVTGSAADRRGAAPSPQELRAARPRRGRALPHGGGGRRCSCSWRAGSSGACRAPGS